MTLLHNFQDEPFKNHHQRAVGERSKRKPDESEKDKVSNKR